MDMKVGLFVCDDADHWGNEEGAGEWLMKRYNIDTEDEEIEWKLFKIISETLPTQTEIKEFEAFIIPGSEHSANEDEEWIDELEDFIRYVYYLQRETPDRSPKLIGVGFGHHAICRALGGVISENENGSYNAGVRTISTTKDLEENSLYQEIFGDSVDKITLFAAHGEEITELPGDAVVCASSEICKNEIVTYGCEIITLQGHPEYQIEDFHDIIIPYLQTNEILTEEEIQAVSDSVEEECNGQDMMQMIIRYIKSEDIEI